MIGDINDMEMFRAGFNDMIKQAGLVGGMSDFLKELATRVDIKGPGELGNIIRNMRRDAVKYNIKGFPNANRPYPIEGGFYKNLPGDYFQKRTKILDSYRSGDWQKKFLAAAPSSEKSRINKMFAKFKSHADVFDKAAKGHLINNKPQLSFTRAKKQEAAVIEKERADAAQILLKQKEKNAKLLKNLGYAGAGAVGINVLSGPPAPRVIYGGYPSRSSR